MFTDAVLLEYSQAATTPTTTTKVNSTLEELCLKGMYDFGFQKNIKFQHISGTSRWVYEGNHDGTEYGEFATCELIRYAERSKE